uniref:Kinesin-like protein n=1 Tax=Phallusia mammillata TaxID=59560 RepID=A0A6F9DGQ3_9ASCI|nr:kinesin-like protein KIF9 [Phallusia mammillata]
MATNAFEGYNGTLMAYGQTGAGKTFTITGATENYKQRGVIPRAIAQIFRSIEEQSDKSVSVRISYLEIYNENMFDLLSTLPESGASSSGYGDAMTIVEGGDGSVCVKGLSLHTANNEGEALNLLFEGETNRAIAAHSLNKNSSRSHCVFTIHIESRSRTESNAKYVTSKLNLVDLAGSERIGKTGSEGQIQREAMYINKSLSFLEQTVIALADKNRGHVPYRQTKLTHVLKDSIGGRCCTTLIANVYGDAAQLEETISTLRFAMRMMCVPVQAAVNDHYDPWLLVRELESEIKQLKQELAMHNTLANRSQVNYGVLSDGQIADIKKQVRLFLEGKTSEIDVTNLRHVSAVFGQFRNVVMEMENAVTEQYKRKFVLLDKTDSDIMLTLQKAGLPLDDEGNYIGGADGSHGAGGQHQAATAVHPISIPGAKVKAGGSIASPKRRSGKKSRAGGSPTSRAPASPSPPVMSDAGAKLAKSGGGVGAATDTDSARKDSVSAESNADERKATSRPSTPPSRAQVFEEFKKEQGIEITRILNENKQILLSKKQMVRDMAHAVNATKHMIDGCRVALERKKNERMEQGEFVNEDGEPVIDEEEFQLITQLKNLKQTYRNDYDELRGFKSEVEYCQKLVDQCRQRLIQEFDAWYSESFLQDQQESSAVAGYGSRPGVQVPARLQLTSQQMNLEDDQEKFERIQQELLMDHQDSAAFYNAKMRTQHRQTYERAMAQAQPSRNPPGIPQVQLKNKPPNQLSFVY